MKTEKPGLLIDPARGMAGDMFSAALLSLGVPEDVIVGAMEKAARRLGRVAIEPEIVPVNGAMAIKLHIRLESFQPHLPAGQAWIHLEEAIVSVGLSSPYANLARRDLDILIEAEREVHSDGRLPAVAAKVPAPELDHQEMHRLGISHRHTTEKADEAVLHEAQDILIDVIGAAAGLQYLNVDLDRAVCFSPVQVGGGFVTFSHGRLPVPAPATQAILKKYKVPYATGPVEKELLTPTGASLLAGLQPEFRPRDEAILKPAKIGIGRGFHRINPPGDLRLGLW